MHEEFMENWLVPIVQYFLYVHIGAMYSSRLYSVRESSPIVCSATYMYVYVVICVCRYCDKFHEDCWRESSIWKTGHQWASDAKVLYHTHTIPWTYLHIYIYDVTGESITNRWGVS